MRTDLESELRERLCADGYLFPDYDGYCFANVPETVLSALDANVETDDVPPSGDHRPLPADVLDGVGSGNGYDRVLVVLVDGFGLEFWKRHDHPLLDRFEAAGTVSPLTTIYPSETAAALTTFHTGRLPAAHGVLGWDVYDPADDASYEAFTVDVKAGDEPVDRDMQDVFEGQAIYPALTDAGIDCRHVVPFPETYDGATAHTYGGDVDAPAYALDGFESALREAFTAADEPAFLYAYLPQIDAAAHAAGTDSDAYREAVADTFDAIERALSGLPGGDATDAAGSALDETLVLLTADHGHVDTDTARSVDLESFESVMDGLDRHANGEPVRYAGSPRNVHLHLRGGDGVCDRVRSDLADALDARIFSRQAARDRDLFGAGPESDTFRRRLGDLVVCHRDQAVWYGSDSAKFELVGMHGGLHPDEMLVPVAAAELGRLRG
ncbi:alkaline phosphatase family protein [Natrinema salifodinae]|uniref:Type I phosphodiesterase / nucleotide pyrophosphatase n=1 Tax=Natrinema salifodinae TaxID=1202768 RepID=A0A1I0NEW5_9EURY|nr:alkaline phosphatase family protein [Natrinema salifodinae]SEV99677.1 Type I phosphodiesterase / nucleotide pyrophosphatase [Natrinema salifodinae]